MSKLTAVLLRNFKCFRDEELEIRDLTIFAGLNGMGKSTAIQALLLLRQSFIDRFDRIGRRLRLNGNMVELGTGSDVFFDLADDDELMIGYEHASDEGAILLRSEFRFQYDRSGEILRPVGARKRPDFRDDYYWSESDWRPISELPRELGVVRMPARLFSQNGFQYLSAERLGPRKMLPASEEAIRKGDFGKQGEYVLGLLAQAGDKVLPETDPRRHEDASSLSVRAQVEAWLQEASPGTRIEITTLRDIDAFASRFSYDRKGDVPSKPFRPANVGFGLSYVLPVVSALLFANRGDLVIIENPEAHLHPRGQTRIGQLAARAASTGVQVIIETHSDHFLDGVRIDVREERLPAPAASIHYFTRFGAEAAIFSPEILPDGRLSEWPEGFFDEKDGNLARLLAPIAGLR